MIQLKHSMLKRINRLFSYSYKELWVFVASWIIYLKWDVLISLCKYKNWTKHLTIQTDKTHQSSGVSSLTESTVNELTPNESAPSDSTTNESTANESKNADYIFQLIRINEAAGRNHFRKMNCLRRCLCQKEMLNNRAIQSKLHIGVKFVEGKLAAHSWLTHNNQLINDSAELVSTYTELTQKLNQKTLAAFI